MLDSLLRGEAPFLSHLLYTQVLDDNILPERNLGISAGLAWGVKAELTAVYVDFGETEGMMLGRKHALTFNRSIVERLLAKSADWEFRNGMFQRRR